MRKDLEWERGPTMEFEGYYLDLFEMLNTCCKKKVPPVNMTRPIPSNYLNSQKRSISRHLYRF
jgi:hypothetical protein